MRRSRMYQTFINTYSDWLNLVDLPWHKQIIPRLRSEYTTHHCAAGNLLKYCKSRDIPHVVFIDLLQELSEELTESGRNPEHPFVATRNEYNTNMFEGTFHLNVKQRKWFNDRRSQNAV